MLLYIFVFFAGASVGSFANVCAIRTRCGKDFVFGRSACPECGSALRAADLIPVLSFIILRGRCGHCGARIDKRYLIVEIVSGALFALGPFFCGTGSRLFIYLAMVSILLVASMIDIDCFRIPNGLVLLGAVSGALLRLVFGASPPQIVFGLLAGSIPLFAVCLLSGGGMGEGDVKLGAVIGIFLGCKLVLVALFMAFLSAAAAGVLLIASGRKSRKDPIPFGPFLSFGAVFAFLFGERFLSWYFGFF